MRARASHRKLSIILSCASSAGVQARDINGILAIERNISVRTNYWWNIFLGLCGGLELNRKNKCHQIFKWIENIQRQSQTRQGLPAQDAYARGYLAMGVLFPGARSSSSIEEQTGGSVYVRKKHKVTDNFKDHRYNCENP